MMKLPKKFLVELGLVMKTQSVFASPTDAMKAVYKKNKYFDASTVASSYHCEKEGLNNINLCFSITDIDFCIDRRLLSDDLIVEKLSLEILEYEGVKYFLMDKTNITAQKSEAKANEVLALEGELEPKDFPKKYLEGLENEGLLLKIAKKFSYLFHKETFENKKLSIKTRIQLLDIFKGKLNLTYQLIKDIEQPEDMVALMKTKGFGHKSTMFKWFLDNNCAKIFAENFPFELVRIYDDILCVFEDDDFYPKTKEWWENRKNVVAQLVEYIGENILNVKTSIEVDDAISCLNVGGLRLNNGNAKPLIDLLLSLAVTNNDMIKIYRKLRKILNKEQKIVLVRKCNDVLLNFNSDFCDKMIAEHYMAHNHSEYVLNHKNTSPNIIECILNEKPYKIHDCLNLDKLTEFAKKRYYKESVFKNYKNVFKTPTEYITNEMRVFAIEKFTNNVNEL